MELLDVSSAGLVEPRVFCLIANLWVLMILMCFNDMISTNLTELLYFARNKIYSFLFYTVWVTFLSLLVSSCPVS